MEAEVRAVEREVGVGMGGKRPRECDVPLGDRVGDCGVVDVLPEQVDRRSETVRPQLADDRERGLLIEPGEVPPGPPEEDVTRLRPCERHPLDAIARREPEGRGAGDASNGWR